MLIPELKEWNNGLGIEHETWVGIEGRIEYALAYSSMFWPEFILLHDCIFMENMSEQQFDAWYTSCHGSLTSVEAAINHRHLDMLYGNATKEQYLYLGRILKSMWKTKLVTQFPDRQITIDFDENQYTITVYQEQHQA